MARAWIQLPYDEEAGRTPWAPAQRILTAAEKLGYRVDRHVRLGDGREVLRIWASGTNKQPPT